MESHGVNKEYIEESYLLVHVSSVNIFESNFAFFFLQDGH